MSKREQFVIRVKGSGESNWICDPDEVETESRVGATVSRKNLSKKQAEAMMFSARVSAEKAVKRFQAAWPSYSFTIQSTTQARLDEATRLVVRNLIDQDHKDLASTVLEFLEGDKLTEEDVAQIRNDFDLPVE